jgi:diacylglycerol kinase family enzyme
MSDLPAAGDRAARRARRLWAWLALAALAALALSAAALVVRSSGPVLLLVLELGVYLAVGLAAAWWALTTRKGWKRGLNVVLIALAAVLLVASLLAFSLWRAGGVAAVVLSALLYAMAARRALRPRGDLPATRSWPPEPGGAGPPARPWLLVNPRSGDGAAGRTGLVEAARARGIQVHLLAAGDDPAALARAAVAGGADALGVAGGDGSLGPVAAVAVEAGVPFVCVPAGTRNHFAHDLGLDRADPVAALDAFAGPGRRVDAAVVSGRMFLNNVSLGAYADIVADRRYRARKLGTARIVLRRTVRGEREPLAVVFQDPAGRRYQDVLVLMVSNNRYQAVRPSQLGARERLDEGVLQVSVLRARTGAALAGVAVRAVAGRATAGDGWALWDATALRVDTALRQVPAGVDGEATVLHPPLEFRVLPRALHVLLPPAPQRPAPVPHPFTRLALRRGWGLASGRAASL